MRAYARNQFGISYGTEKTFTTNQQKETDIDVDGYPDDSPWDSSYGSKTPDIHVDGYPTDSKWDSPYSMKNSDIDVTGYPDDSKWD